MLTASPFHRFTVSLLHVFNQLCWNDWRRGDSLARFMRCDGPFIMGTGLVTALGDGVDATWKALLAGESIGSHSPAKMQSDGPLPRVSQLAAQAAREAIRQASWQGENVASDRTALLVGTSRGPIHQWIEGAEPAPAM